MRGQRLGADIRFPVRNGAGRDMTRRHGERVSPRPRGVGTAILQLAVLPHRPPWRSLLSPLAVATAIAGGAAGLRVTELSSDPTLFTFSPAIAAWAMASLFLSPAAPGFPFVAKLFVFLNHSAMVVLLVLLASFIRWSRNEEPAMRLTVMDVLLGAAVYAAGLSLPIDPGL